MAKSLDGVLTKKAHTKEKFTEEQVQHLLACADPNTGYEYFAKNFFYIQHPVKGKVLFEPFEYQIRLLHSYHDFRFNINMLQLFFCRSVCFTLYRFKFLMLKRSNKCIHMTNQSLPSSFCFYFFLKLPFFFIFHGLVHIKCCNFFSVDLYVLLFTNSSSLCYSDQINVYI